MGSARTRRGYLWARELRRLCAKCLPDLAPSEVSICLVALLVIGILIHLHRGVRAEPRCGRCCGHTCNTGDNSLMRPPPPRRKPGGA